MTDDDYGLAWLAGLAGIPRQGPERDDFGWEEAFRDSLDALVQYCIRNRENTDSNLLEEALACTMSDTPLQWMYYWEIAAIGILMRGPTGAAQLASILRRPTKSLSPGTIIQTLWRVGAGQALISRSEHLTSHLPNIDLPDGTDRAAKIALDDLIIDSQADSYVFSKLVNQVSIDATGSASHGSGFARYFMQVSSESAITLTQRVLDDFAEMIGKELPEEAYQVFLKANPVLLDPLSAEVLAKHRLGTDLITDFVIRRHDYSYIAVEIEKPHDKIFTKKNDFTAHFTHAFGQVIDFQRWVSGNIAYAEKSLPRVDKVHGLLVMGRRSALSSEQEQKLRWWEGNSNNIDIYTFDDILNRGQLLLGSLRRQSHACD